MVIFNDVGLAIEIIGFILFLITPASPQSFLLINEGSDNYRYNFLAKRLPEKIGLPLRIIAIPLIVIGLAMQFTFFNLP